MNQTKKQTTIACRLFFGSRLRFGENFPIQPGNAGHAVHAVVGVADRTTIRISHGELVAVLVVGIGNYITVTIRHGDQVSLLVVLIGDGSFGRSYSCYLSNFVVAALDVLPFPYILGGEIDMLTQKI